MSYDDWKLASPPEYDAIHFEPCAMCETDTEPTERSTLGVHLCRLCEMSLPEDDAAARALIDEAIATNRTQREAMRRKVADMRQLELDDVARMLGYGPETSHA